LAIKSNLARLMAALAALVSAQAVAAPVTARVTDCPLRDLPFSATRSPVIDLLRSPAAKAVVVRELPGLFEKLPPMMIRTTAPSFGSIITLKDLAGFARQDTGAAIDRIDAELRKLPITAADKRARCERYDNDAPKLSLPAGRPNPLRPRLLLFEKMTGFRDDPGVNAAHAAFVAMAGRKGWALVSTDKAGVMTPASLRRFDAVIWNNVSGDVLTLAQRRAFRDYIEHGGGFVGVHGSAGDPVYFWDWYADTLIGARFAGHPITGQFQDAKVVIDDIAHPVAQGLPAAWTMKDEWYSFHSSPRAAGAHVIATLDETTYDPAGWPGQELHMGDHPIAWTNCVGAGRMFYSAIGHLPGSYSEPHVVTLLEQGVAYAAGAGPAACSRRGNR
jgi:type 1 glutamine amidotransferase